MGHNYLLWYKKLHFWPNGPSKKFLRLKFWLSKCPKTAHFFCDIFRRRVKEMHALIEKSSVFLLVALARKWVAGIGRGSNFGVDSGIWKINYHTLQCRVNPMRLLIISASKVSMKLRLKLYSRLFFDLVQFYVILKLMDLAIICHW